MAGPAAVATAQVPAGAEFRVNTTTADRQLDPDADAAPSGDFVVTWTGRVAAQYDVFAQRYSASGAALGGEFRVNTSTTGVQRRGKVAVHRNGSFVIVWPSSQAQPGIWAQRYDAAGVPLGAELRVDTTTLGGTALSVGMDRRGDFVVAWWNSAPLDPSGGVFAQRVSAQGALLGAEFRVNTYTTGSQILPTVAVQPAGDFVIAWMSNNQDGSAYSVFGQRYAAGGAPIGGEFRVHSATAGDQKWPEAGVDARGNFVVAWTELGRDGSDYGVFAQRFDPAGSRVGADFGVNTYTTGNQNVTDVKMGESGAFLVTWNSVGQDGSGGGAFGQRFRSDGTRRGAEFRVNTYTTNAQGLPTIAHDRAGNFAVAWASQAQDGSDYGIYAQRFGGIVPTALAVDTPANGVLEPGETVRMAPTWRNSTGTTQAITGHLDSFDGPAGASYSVPDADADYGVVADGATATCGVNCYMVGVSDAATRPALHWDATAVERILPDAQGQEKPWAVHVGRSFTDVSAQQPLLPVRRDGAPQRDHGRMRAFPLLPVVGHDARADGGLHPAGQGRNQLPSAGVQRHAAVRGCPAFEPVLPVGRGAGAARCRGRLRERELLPRKRRDPRADGGLHRPAA